MVKEKLSRKHVIMFSFLICIASCSNIYENKIAEMLCIQDFSVFSYGRYESHAIGEWYIIERYILYGDILKQLNVNKNMKASDIQRHPLLEDYYWIGWNPMSEHSPIYDILLESAHFHANNSLVREYKECCYSDDVCYYTIMIRDSAELHNDLYEKTAVVFAARTNTLYICNYHY